MSVEKSNQDQLHDSNSTSESTSSASILSWIQNIQTPPTSSYTPNLPNQTPTRGPKRPRSLDSPPSDFLRGGPSFYKKRRTLHEATENMGEKGASGLPTPSKDGSSSSMSKTSSTSMSQSVSKSTSSTNPQTPKRQKTSTDQDIIGFKMSLYGLLQDDEAFEKATDFNEHIFNIVTSERGSAMKAASVKKFRTHLKVYKWANEATFLYHVMPILQGDGYHIAGLPSITPGEEKYHLQENIEWKEFLTDEKVIVTLNRDFAKTLLPHRFSEAPLLIDEIAKSLAKDKEMTNPRPDIAFGIQRDKYPLAIEQIPQHILDLLEIAPGMHYPFLIIEGKSHAGDSARAEVQARRGGVTLVKALRTLQAKLERGVEQETAVEENEGSVTAVGKGKGKANPITPDYKSFVFSITILPTYFSIWVHWYDEGSQLYHMNLVESYALNNSKGPVQIRWALHNIIEFGVRTRGPQYERLSGLIEKYAQAYKQRARDDLQTAKEDVKAAKLAAKMGRSSAQSATSGSNKRSMPEDEA